MAVISESELIGKAAETRRTILQTALKAGKGHVPPAFSWVEIAVALYYGDLLDYRPAEPRWSDRDRFLLSKGHGCLTLYAILADLGFFPASELEAFAGDGGMLAGHPDPEIPGVESISGSLGHGLGVGAGLALSARIDGKNWRSVVLMGDGECHEGSVWEGAMFAAHHGLSNLTAIIDRNQLAATGFTEDIVRLEPLADKWRAFGWRVQNVDGHDFSQLMTTLGGALSTEGEQSNQPMVIIADTVKGKGVGFMENSPDWHHRMPKEDEIIEAERALEGEGG